MPMDTFCNSCVGFEKISVQFLMYMIKYGQFSLPCTISEVLCDDLNVLS